MIKFSILGSVNPKTPKPQRFEKLQASLRSNLCFFAPKSSKKVKTDFIINTTTNNLYYLTNSLYNIYQLPPTFQLCNYCQTLSHEKTKSSKWLLCTKASSTVCFSDSGSTWKLFKSKESFVRGEAGEGEFGQFII